MSAKGVFGLLLRIWPLAESCLRQRIQWGVMAALAGSGGLAAMPHLSGDEMRGWHLFDRTRLGCVGRFPYWRAVAVHAVLLIAVFVAPFEILYRLDSFCDNGCRRHQSARGEYVEPDAAYRPAAGGCGVCQRLALARAGACSGMAGAYGDASHAFKAEC